MVRKGFLHGKETPSSNLISHHEQTNLIFPENEKRLAKTLVPMYLCLKHLSLKKYVTMFFCLNTCYLHLCSHVTLSQISVIKIICHSVLLSKTSVTYVFVPMLLCLKHTLLKKYVTISFCLKSLFFCHKNGFSMP